MTQTTTEPVAGFLQFDLDPRIQRGIAALGFSEPRPIQAQTIPAGLEGRDVLGLAQTGTGKTAAFALPILQRLLKLRRPGPRALIVAPTRELAMQIEAEIKALAQFTGLKTVTIFGGVGSIPQIEALKRRPDIIVACPGRLLDLMGQGALSLDTIEVCVLDEADHMFDMGFLPDVRRILNALPAKRQNMLFSATMPPEIRQLADKLLVDPHVVELDFKGPAKTVEHVLFRVSQQQKTDLLLHLLETSGFGSAIVFCRTKFRAKRLADQLIRAGHKAIALQGNMSQPQRDKAMGGFRGERYDVLVATDIASRGIDVAQVSHVINYDVPNTPDAYTHRIGRTGRSERSGTAYTFVAAEDYALVHAIERRIGAKIPRLDPPAFEKRADLAAPGVRRAPAEAEPVEEATEESRGGEDRRRRRRRRPGAGGASRSELPRTAESARPPQAEKAQQSHGGPRRCDQQQLSGSARRRARSGSRRRIGSGPQP